MNTFRAILFVGILGAFVGTVAHADNQFGWQQPDTSPTAEDGEWRDELLSSEQLSVLDNTEVRKSYLLLQLQEYLYWEQTLTYHFASGEFFHTEAVSDSVRLASVSDNQYFTTGIYTSTVFDAGYAVDWTSVNWSHSRPSQAIRVEYRTGNMPIPNDMWSGWAVPRMRPIEFLCLYISNWDRNDCSSNMWGIESSRYIQYRAIFNSDSPSQSVALLDMDILYGTHYLTGTAVSKPISPVNLLAWEKVFYTSTVSVSTSLSIDVLSSVDETVLVPDVSSGSSLSSINPVEHPSIRLRAVLTTGDVSLTPAIDIWAVGWEVDVHRLYLPVVFH